MNDGVSLKRSMILAVAADGIFGASPPPVFFCSLASSVNSFLACACKFFNFSLTSVVVLRATPTALTASAFTPYLIFSLVCDAVRSFTLFNGKVFLYFFR